MKASLVLGAGRGPRLEVLERIKRSGVGMSVKELAADLGMSYMGVKSHCVALASEGCLAPWRKPSKRGRPMMLYRIAPAGERLFSGPDTDLSPLLLKEAIGLYGPNAAKKLLVMLFRTLARSYSAMIGKGGAEERAVLFAKIRDREGRMSKFIQGNPWEIKECHQLNAHIIADHPEIRSLEEHMVTEVLGAPVRREEDQGVVIFRPR